MSSKMSCGSDPEFMLKDRKGNLKSAVEVIPGVPEDRIVIGPNEFYHDNVMAECAIAPGSSKEETIHNFRTCFQSFAKLVSPYKLVPQASAIYPDKELQSEDAKKAGCSEEYCAYGMCPLPKRTEEIAENPFRSAGGHVHIGVESGVVRNEPHWGVKMMDLFVGIPALFLDHDPTSQARKALYGNAGSHRPKDYGFEYRALGNFWLTSPKSVALIYDLSEFVVDFCNEKRYLEFWRKDEKIYEETDSLSRSLICFGYDTTSLRNNLDKGVITREAASFLALIKKYLPKKLWKDFDKEEQVFDNMYKEWGIHE